MTWKPAARGGNPYGHIKQGRRADIGTTYFRSGWEANYARWLEFLRMSGKISSWEHEPQEFEFPVKRGNRFYLPDFRVTFPDGRVEWHEVKGYMSADSRVKLQRFAKYYPHEKLVLIDAAAYGAIKRTASMLIPHWE